MRVVAGGVALSEGINDILDKLGDGPLIFNLGHGITPQADPRNVQLLVDRVRSRRSASSWNSRPMREPGARCASARPFRDRCFSRLLARVGYFVWIRMISTCWIKALHVIAVISWMAGLFYMPRLFIYHTDAEPGSEQSETFKIMERRLLKVIMNPAMMITWVFGLYLAWVGLWLSWWLAAREDCCSWCS